MINSIDVLFLGGGLSTCMASRYLKLRHPQLNIAVVERKTSAQWNPGESSVSIAGLFFSRELQLSTYLYLNHLPKNGLRFFFQPEKTTDDISLCSEIGSNSLPYFPTFQMDRKKIVEDLWKMNQELGIKHQFGVEIADLVISSTDEPHRIKMTDGAIYHAKWLIHGAGRESKYAPLFNQLSPYIEDPDHQTAAAWGRWKNVEDIDSMGNDDWKSKAGHTARYLSTNHFMGEGYWIWQIPIGQGIVSMGVVFDKKHLQQIKLETQEQYQTFLNQHPFVSKMLKNAQPLDFQHNTHLAFKRKNFCSTNRWALIGDTFMFLDPFYSPGSDCISRESKHLEHLVLSNKQTLPIIVNTLNTFTENEYQLLKTIYLNQYPAFGCYEVYDIKSLWDFYSYTYRLLSSFVERRHEDLEWLKEQNDPSQIPFQLIQAIQKGFIDLYEYLKEKKVDKQQNTGKYSLKQNRFTIEEKMLRKDFNEIDMIRHHIDLCRYVICKLLESRFSLQNLLAIKPLQTCLTIKTMSDFQLNTDWTNQLLLRLQEQLTQQGFRLDHGQLNIDNFSIYDNEFKKMPQSQSQLWRGPVTNLVATQEL